MFNQKESWIIYHRMTNNNQLQSYQMQLEWVRLLNK